jgi:hypothetical protein
MSIQDWQDIRGWFIFSGERMRAHRHREILCCKSHQQETHGGKRTYGENECRSNSADDWTEIGQVRNEIAVLKKVSMGHQNILTLVDYFETMNNRPL